MTEITRCSWGENADELYQTYHDQEWGKLNLNEQYLYEMLVLETFQSGLSWSTILHKRENFRHDFANFDVEKVAKFNTNDFSHLVNDKGIVRNKLKIKAAINNAQVLVNWHHQGKTFAQFLVYFVPIPIDHHPHALTDIPSSTDLSKTISKEMKKLGFKFVGPTTIYSFLQAVGLVNDHLDGCSFRK